MRACAPLRAMSQCAVFLCPFGAGVERADVIHGFRSAAGAATLHPWLQPAAPSGRRMWVLARGVGAPEDSGACELVRSVRSLTVAVRFGDAAARGGWTAPGGCAGVGAVGLELRGVTEVECADAGGRGGPLPPAPPSPGGGRRVRSGVWSNGRGGGRCAAGCDARRMCGQDVSD